MHFLRFNRFPILPLYSRTPFFRQEGRSVLFPLDKDGVTFFTLSRQIR